MIQPLAYIRARARLYRPVFENREPRERRKIGHRQESVPRRYPTTQKGQGANPPPRSPLRLTNQTAPCQKDNPPNPAKRMQPIQTAAMKPIRTNRDTRTVPKEASKSTPFAVKLLRPIRIPPIPKTEETFKYRPIQRRELDRPNDSEEENEETEVGDNEYEATACQVMEGTACGCNRSIRRKKED